MPGLLWLLPGVVLPLVTLGVELTTRMSAETFFDPLPTWLHVLLVALVPAANAAAWWAARRESPRHLRRIALANGAAIGVALFYTILFLPLTPIGLIAISFYAMGLLPLTPLFALVAAFRLRFSLARLAGQPCTRAAMLGGVLLAIAALTALEIPATVTRIGLEMALAPDRETRARGVKLLRLAGSEALLLRLCYVRSGLATDMVGFLFHLASRPAEPEEVRKVYYRVTGTPFNAVPAPAAARPGRGPFSDRGIEWDRDQGADSVGGQVPGLSLAASRLDGSLDANAALGYLEWTMVFRNASRLNREARVQIALPPGAAVSRVTLWIDGEEREAAFAGRARVREAYQRIVRQNRDPVLVTTAGPDRVAMQLFPVPPGGEMKVRLGITAPLALRSRREAALRLPHLQERNFAIPGELQHAVWIDSGQGTTRRDLGEAQLTASAEPLLVERTAGEISWTTDSRSGAHLVLQRLEERPALMPRRLAVVVDGSAAMREAIAPIVRALKRLPQDLEVEIFVAADDAANDAAGIRFSGIAGVQRLPDLSYSGGHDNVGTLARAWDRVAAEEGGALLWIHGPQPVLLETVEPLLQRLERNPIRPAWYSLQVRPGPNRVLEQLDGKASIETLQLDDLERLVARWRPGATELRLRRERIKPEDARLRAADKTSDHLARLWAHEQILALALSSTPKARENAIELAQRYQLVTPLSGAVVLETQRQYEAAGLQPVEAGSVPTIPEPEQWALLAAALLILLYSYGWHWRRPGTRLAA